VDGVLSIPNHRLWELNDPFLYRVTARVQAAGSVSVDEYSVRCGFRDFRFERDYFRLNGRRIYLHGALYTILQYPISQTTPFDEDLLRRDILNMKMTGFNCIRITCGAALPRQLDLMDEMGLLACEEHFGAREPADLPISRGAGTAASAR
jgi:beta-galactosidase/beta-glucuronidase